MTFGALCLLVAPLASAQKIHDVHHGSANQGRLGRAVGIALDVNNDGFDDVVAGQPGLNQVLVWSGIDGSLLYTLMGAPSSSTGVAVDGAGDVNGDGHGDILVGAPSGGVGGEVFVYSGLDGTVIHTLRTPTGSNLGTSVAGVGDVNLDGFDDILVGDPTDTTGPGTPGGAKVFSGVDGALLFHFLGDNHVDRFGTDVGAAGDVNADGKPDFIVGVVSADPNGNGSGMARVLSGADGSVLWDFNGTATGECFGASVDGAGDVNADGFDDLIVAAGDGNFVRVFSGLTGAVLYEFTGDTVGFGQDVAGVGDIDGDGFDDVSVGDPSSSLSRPVAHIYSGQTGNTLFSVYSPNNDDRFGEALSGGGDVNGDGRPDFVIGGSGDDHFAGNGGAIFVVGGANEVGTRYCSPAVPNSTGVPGKLTVYGSNVIADRSLTLHIDDIGSGQFGFFLVSMSQGIVQPPMSAGPVCLSGNIGRINGPMQIFEGFSARLRLDLNQIPLNPTAPVLPGETLNFQAWYRDPGATNFTDAASVSFL